eukprot:7377602-Prymnesium_polylepis.1
MCSTAVLRCRREREREAVRRRPRVLRPQLVTRGADPRSPCAPARPQWCRPPAAAFRSPRCTSPAAPSSAGGDRAPPHWP